MGYNTSFLPSQGTIVIRVLGLINCHVLHANCQLLINFFLLNQRYSVTERLIKRDQRFQTLEAKRRTILEETDKHIRML